MSLIGDAVAARATAMMFDRIADRLEARLTLASAFAVTLGRMSGGTFQPASESWTASMPSEGRAEVDLGDGYSLEFNERKSQILIKNETTGEVTNVWGDPHIDWNQDGRTDANFWGTTTFELENGTKVTIETEPWKNNENAYVASKVTVTKGDNAVVIDGVSQNELGDLSVTQSQNGLMTDLVTDDGFTVVENADGEGWVNPETGNLATQEDFNVTKPGASEGLEFDSAFSAAIASFLMLGFVSGIFAAAQSGTAQEGSQTLNAWFRPDV